MYNKYLVKEGENIKTLASKFGVSPEELIRINNLYYGEGLRAGQEIIVPKMKKSILIPML